MNKTESIKHYDLDDVQWKFVDMLTELEDRILEHKSHSKFHMPSYKVCNKIHADIQKFFQHHRIKGV